MLFEPTEKTFGPRTLAPAFPKPLRRPLRVGKLGCLRTRAIAPGPFDLRVPLEGRFAYARELRMSFNRILDIGYGIWDGEIGIRIRMRMRMTNGYGLKAKGCRESFRR